MKYQLLGDYFDGVFHQPENKDEEILKNCPADTNTTLWQSFVDYKHIEPVIESATQGFHHWRKTPVSKRIELIETFGKIATQKKEEIATAIALDTGKPLWESMTEASAIEAKVKVTIGESLKRVSQQTIESVLPSIDGHTLFKPIGPSLVIGPFNFPCHLANGQILSALITGNSIIFKPSEKTIHSSQKLIECFHEAGFPKGVVNFINGTIHTTQSILKHPAIKGIFFTGSLAVGKKILESVGTDLTKVVALELGGKNTTIIHQDAQIEHAVTEVIRACFLSSGQRCTSTSIIAVHESLEKKFIEEFSKVTKRIIVDHPTDFKMLPFMGPLIDEMALSKYNAQIQMGVENGARFIVGPKEISNGYIGHYASATIQYLETMEKSNPFTQEEIFGPNVCITPYSDIERAIEIANFNDYGLASAIFTQDSDIYQQALMEIDAGIINLNRSTVGASSRLPFGGVKNSGNHHPAAVAMVDHTVVTVSSLETKDSSSKVSDIKGLSEPK